MPRYWPGPPQLTALRGVRGSLSLTKAWNSTGWEASPGREGGGRRPWVRKPRGQCTRPSLGSLSPGKLWSCWPMWVPNATPSSLPVPARVDRTHSGEAWHQDTLWGGRVLRSLTEHLLQMHNSDINKNNPVFSGDLANAASSLHISPESFCSRASPPLLPHSFNLLQVPALMSALSHASRKTRLVSSTSMR